MLKYIKLINESVVMNIKIHITLSRYSCHFLVAFMYVEDVYKHRSRFNMN